MTAQKETQMSQSPIAAPYDNIGYEVDGHKATIINRPQALNALSPHMVGELRAAYAEAEGNDDVWLILITGSGRAFCAGADVGEIPDDGRVIYDEPLPEHLAAVGGAPGGDPAVPHHDQAGA